MRKTLLLSTLMASSLMAAENLTQFFSEGKVNGNVKYYYIETNKDLTSKQTSAHANSIGGQLSYKTGKLYGIEMGATFMTTNPFALPNAVDTSIIGRDNAVQQGKSPGDKVAQEGFSVLGESYIKYSRDFFDIWYGRQVIKTPLIHAKEVRMLPSAVQGSMARAAFENGLEFGLGYLDRFKQRTSNDFVNIVKHALGANTQEITGSDEGYVAIADAEWHNKHHDIRIYDYYSENFMNSAYIDAVHNHYVSDTFSWNVGLQGMYQNSIGNATENLNANAAKYAGEINSMAWGLKAGVSWHDATFLAAYTSVLEDKDGEHNSLVLPYDGTPLFTDMITSNDLFTSNYGSGLTSSAGYIAGTSGFKLGYAQKYDFTGVKGFKSVLAFAQYDNKDFTKGAQQDINAVAQYSYQKFVLQLKGIWVKNNSGANALEEISQIDSLTQYRVIANYKF